MGDLQEAMAALRRLPLFARLDDNALQAVARRAVICPMRPGAELFRRGEPCAGLHVVLEGAVRVFRPTTDGGEQTAKTEGPGQALAEVPLFDGGPYTASARAVEEGRVLFLPRDDFHWLYTHHADIADAVIRDLGRRLRRVVGLVEKISLRDVPARVSMALLEHAEVAGCLRDGAELVLPMTQEELAAELATTRESVARALARLREDGAIRQSGRRVQILSLAMLERVASGETACVSA